MAAMVIALLVGACSDATSSAPTDHVHPTPLPSGLTLVCTDRHETTTTMGPLEDGQYVHFVCDNGKVTSWWIDGNKSMEDAPPH